MGQINALLRREYHLRPERLTDTDWCRLYAEYRYTEQVRLENMRQAFRAALVEVVNAAFGGKSEQ